MEFNSAFKGLIRQSVESVGAPVGGDEESATGCLEVMQVRGLHRSPNIIQVTKSRRVRRARHVARAGKMGGANSFSLG